MHLLHDHLFYSYANILLNNCHYSEFDFFLAETIFIPLFIEIWPIFFNERF